VKVTEEKFYVSDATHAKCKELYGKEFHVFDERYIRANSDYKLTEDVLFASHVPDCKQQKRTHGFMEAIKVPLSTFRPQFWIAGVRVDRSYADNFNMITLRSTDNLDNEKAGFGAVGVTRLIVNGKRCTITKFTDPCVEGSERRCWECTDEDGNVYSQKDHPDARYLPYDSAAEPGAKPGTGLKFDSPSVSWVFVHGSVFSEVLRYHSVDNMAVYVNSMDAQHNITIDAERVPDSKVKKYLMCVSVKDKMV